MPPNGTWQDPSFSIFLPAAPVSFLGQAALALVGEAGKTVLLSWSSCTYLQGVFSCDVATVTVGVLSENSA